MFIAVESNKSVDTEWQFCRRNEVSLFEVVDIPYPWSVNDTVALVTVRITKQVLCLLFWIAWECLFIFADRL